ncbi:MAG: aquaporin [Ruminococcaceae bacterium]|nr:aquaporin [Oscillospiraceae bacterium]
MQKNIVKYICEFLGTAFFVVFGCGTAISVGYNSSIGSGYLITALAFGLTLTVLSYILIDISGCHINPVISLAMLIDGRIKFTTFIGYTVSQYLGGILGGAILFLIVEAGGVADLSGDYLEGTSALGANSISNLSNNPWVAIIVEVLLTFVFVMAVLKITANPSLGFASHILLGLSLTLVHILGIALTGTSVNPARSLGPAIFAGGEYIKTVWVFFAGPIIGSMLAALIYPVIVKKEYTLL